MEPGQTAPRKRVIVIGAGIAGLTTAYYLRKHGIDVDIIEREKFVGGNVRTALKDDDYLIEYGPHSFSSDSGPVVRLARELSIDTQIVECNVNPKKRYVFHRGRFRRVPRGAFSVMTRGLIPVAGKLRLSLEPFIRGRSKKSESLAEFVLRRAGRRVLDSYAEPLVTGACAGDPAQLEAESILPSLVDLEAEGGSFLRKIPRLIGDVPRGGMKSLRWGMGTIAARLEEELRRNLMTDVAVERIDRMAGDRLSVAIDVAARTLSADAVVIATPAPEAARLLMQIDREILAPLMGISYVSLIIAYMAFNSGDVESKNLIPGFVIPRTEGIRILGAVCNSTLYSGRCPGGETLISSYLGGATDPDVIDCSDEEIKLIVLSGLEKTMGIRAEPKFIHIKRWKQVIPQYTIGHSRRIAKIKSRLKSQPGIFLAGNYLAGLSVANTITHARGVVDDVLEYLKEYRPCKNSKQET